MFSITFKCSQNFFENVLDQIHGAEEISVCLDIGSGVRVKSHHRDAHEKSSIMTDIVVPATELGRLRVSAGRGRDDVVCCTNLFEHSSRSC